MSDSNGFSQNARLFATSAAHAETGDLDLVLETLGDVDDLEVLDVATGTGHTAFFFARHEAHVFAVDINDEMLAVAQEESDRKSLSCRFLKGFANDLPFDDGKFDLVTTRLAAHHFKAPGDFLAEAHRVLKPGGRIMLIDNVVPDGDTGAWINDYEIKRDPTHAACLTSAQWLALFQSQGFENAQTRDYPKVLDYDQWMQRMSIEGKDADALWSELTGASTEVVQFLQPVKGEAETRTITLHRIIVVAAK